MALYNNLTAEIGFNAGIFEKHFLVWKKSIEKMNFRMLQD